MSDEQQRRLAFGAVAELYDAVRPSYPATIVDDVLAVAPRGHALEVGAGTGIATRLFAERGVAIHALEPSAEMAAVARARCSAYPDVSIEEHDFELFKPGDKRFQLVYAAQSWHWISPELRYAKAREVLAPRGVLAVFWNRALWSKSPLRAALNEAYARAAPDFAATPGPGPLHPGTQNPQAELQRWQRELGEAPGFAAAQARAHEWSRTYSATAYVELLRTHSDHMLRPPAEQSALHAAIRDAIERHGGELRLPLVTILAFARAT